MTDGFLLTKWLLAATLSGISLLAIPAPPIPVKNLPGGYSAPTVLSTRAREGAETY
jgi:hypothetical protein